MKHQHPEGLTLVTGATGYVGGRLLRVFEEQGMPLRCMARRPDHLQSRVARDTEVVYADVGKPDTLDVALRGVDVAYYLIHSMDSSGDFEQLDRDRARNFAEAAARNGVGRIVYLGGLGGTKDLSPHLRSRQEVGEVLAMAGVQVIELRASIVIGSGSLSFELIRSLVHRLPVMITPRWVRTEAQPIAVEDVLQYLSEARTISLEGSRVFEIGGAERVSYGDLMREFARQRGLKRLMIPVPALTPRLSSLWLGLVSPLYASTGRKLIDGVRNATVVEDRSADDVFGVRPLDHRQAIARALINEDAVFARTRWSDALSASETRSSWGGAVFGARLVDSRTRYVPVDVTTAFRPIRRIGGPTGWYFGNPLWRLRGFLDLLVGGVGTRRGRRDPDALAPGDTVDFWRVEGIEANRLLRLRAEMRLPGRAWLQFEVEPNGSGTQIRQTAIFDPAGVFGQLYWYTLWPIHQLVFEGMLRNLANSAGEQQGSNRELADSGWEATSERRHAIPPTSGINSRQTDE